MSKFRNSIFLSAKDIIVITNPTDHSVKVTHVPTGTISECNLYKSAHKNKIEGILLLRGMLLKLEIKNIQ